MVIFSICDLIHVNHIAFTLFILFNDVFSNYKHRKSQTYSIVILSNVAHCLGARPEASLKRSGAKLKAFRLVPVSQ